MGIAGVLVLLGALTLLVGVLRGVRVSASIGVFGGIGPQRGRSHCSGSGVAVLAIRAVAAACLLAAGATRAWIASDGPDAPMRTIDGAERWREAATVTAWRPRCPTDGECGSWQAASTPVMVALDPEVRGVVQGMGAGTPHRCRRRKNSTCVWPDSHTSLQFPSSRLIYEVRH